MVHFQGDIFSAALDMTTRLDIVLPTVRKHQDERTLYLLHGYSQNGSAWTHFSNLFDYVDQYNLAVIIPEIYHSYYHNMAYGQDYFNYLTSELPQICESIWRVNVDREHSFVAGLSMGGYGAIKCALACPEKYAASAGWSGPLDIRWTLDQTLPELRRMREAYALYGKDKIIPKDCDLYYLAERNVHHGQLPRLYTCCGTEDFTFKMNQDFSDFMDALPYEFKFEKWSGGHTWDFWRMALPKTLEFFFNR